MKRRSLFARITGCLFAPFVAKAAVPAPSPAVGIRPSLQEKMAVAENAVMVASGMGLLVRPDDDHNLHIKIHCDKIKRLRLLQMGQEYEKAIDEMLYHTEEHIFVTIGFYGEYPYKGLS